MPKIFNRVSKKLGLPPGSIVHVGEQKTDKVKITVFDYDAKNYEEKEIQNIEDCFQFRDKPSVTWINVDGLENTEVISKIDTHFGIHPLVLEDIVNTGQRPKLDDYGDYFFIVIKMLYTNQKCDEIISEQVSLIVGPNYVISFQETIGGDVFDPVRDRIRNNKGRVRKMGADYLAYVLLDSVVDHYFVVLEKMEEDIEVLEEKLIESSATPELAHQIHYLKRDMVFLRKQVWPLRDVINSLYRDESKLIRKETRFFLRDLYDHTIQVMDAIESFRDLVGGMHDVYLSAMSNKMNEIMKVLTIFSAIFIPLTFVAGVYGMNFEHMPELKWKWGYELALLFMFLIASGLVLFFKKKKWI